MAKSPAFQFYGNDFLTGTLDFSADQIGGYLLLLIHQWDRGWIPNDDAKLRKISRVKQTSLEVIKEKFTLSSDGLLRNHRLEQERAKQEAYRAKQSDNIRKRWNKPKDTTVLPPNDFGNTLQFSSSTSVIKKNAGAENSLSGSECESVNSEVPPRPSHAPTLEQVQEFFYRQDLSAMVDPFFEANEATGWMVAGNPITNWKARAAGWIRTAQRKADKAAEREAKAVKPKGRESSWTPTDRDNY